MHNGEYRKNGGIGFSIKEPTATVEFKKSDKFKVIDKRAKPFGENEKARLLDILENEFEKNSLKHKLKIYIDGELITHSGFGSSSAIRLACLEGLFIKNKFKYSKNYLIKSSKRGGTSGIGINTYFNGGFVFDTGKKNDNSRHEPSSVEKVKEKPLKLIQNNMPKDWEIGICLPNLIKNKSEKEEKEFFQTICPIETNEAYKILYHVVYGLISSIKEKDYINFSNAINNIQKCTWKKSERSLYGEKLLELEKLLYENGALAVGMSSLGPLLFFTSLDMKKLMKKLKKEISHCTLLTTTVNNQGRKIEY